VHVFFLLIVSDVMVEKLNGNSKKELFELLIFQNLFFMFNIISELKPEPHHVAVPAPKHRLALLLSVPHLDVGHQILVLVYKNCLIIRHF
jgi:hypothetical protein